MYERVIKAAYNSESFWRVLVEESWAESGPFDGGCLICAKAILMAFDKGELIRIASHLNGGQTEHYGVSIDDCIYDMDGMAKSAEEWIERFKENEHVNDRELFIAHGLDESNNTPDDPRAVKEIAKLLTRLM